MKCQNLKKYRQKELSLMCKTSEKTRNYIFFLCHATKAEKTEHTCKDELIFDFGGQNETEYNRIYILLLEQITSEKRPENEGERHNVKISLKRRNQTSSSPRDK